MIKPRPLTKKRRVIAGSASWLALVAATSLGVAHAETVRAEVRLPREAVSPGGRYRLIVQSYDKRGHVTAIPASSIRPRGSAQRAVTADELVRGIRVDIIELGERRPGRDDGVVVAWLEPGDADLEFDARAARPAPGSFFGAAPNLPAAHGPVEITLERPLRRA